MLVSHSDAPPHASAYRPSVTSAWSTRSPPVLPMCSETRVGSSRWARIRGIGDNMHALHPFIHSYILQTCVRNSQPRALSTTSSAPSVGTLDMSTPTTLTTLNIRTCSHFSHILQIFHNLIGNSCKFTHTGQIWIAATAKVGTTQTTLQSVKDTITCSHTTIVVVTHFCRLVGRWASCQGFTLV